MQLEVPHYSQVDKTSCGPVTLQMVLAYLEKNYDLTFLKEKTGVKEGKGISTIQIATAAALLGFPTKFFSTTLGFNPENLTMDYYKDYVDIAQGSEVLVQTAHQAGVKMEERQLSLEEILSYVTENSIPIILLDWNIVKNKKEKGYHGHFLPLVGYDEHKVYVHDPGPTNPQANVAIPREIFDEARKAKGTDEDIIVIYKK